MLLISSFVISVADCLLFSFSANKVFKIFENFLLRIFFLALTSGEEIVIPKLIGSNSESSLSKPSKGLKRSVINVIGAQYYQAPPIFFSKKSKPKPNFNDFLQTDKQVLLPRHFDIIQKFPLYIGHIFFNSTRSESVHSSSS